jgi:hypothetical protein
MSKNTVRPALTRKRPKRVVENDQFDAFARRILAAYARRVADGDIEALRSLSGLASDVDGLTRTAVTGLKQFGYSWSEIADRLGVAKQTAFERYGDRSRRGALDRRLTAPGLAVSMADLVAVFTDHYPGVPAASTCPGCGYRYPDGATDCPSNALARPLLYARRAEDKAALAQLHPTLFADLHSLKTARSNRAAAARASARPAPPADRDHTNLLDLIDAASTPETETVP